MILGTEQKIIFKVDKNKYVFLRSIKNHTVLRMFKI